MNIYKRREELKKQLIKERNIAYLEMYNILSELFAVEKQINPKYTILRLAKDNDLHPHYCYRILSWKKATPTIKCYIKEGKLTMPKAVRILWKVRKDWIDYVTKQAVALKMSCSEIDEYIIKYTLECINKRRTYNNHWNISRDILVYSQKLRNTLLSKSNIPPNKLQQVREELIKLNQVVKTVINEISIIKVAE